MRLRTSMRMETSSIEAGSSATMNLGKYQSPRYHHPLALPAKKFVGIPEEEGLWEIRCTSSRAYDTSFIFSSSSFPILCISRSSTTTSYGHLWVKGLIGVLEDDLHLLLRFFSSSLSSLTMSSSSSVTLPIVDSSSLRIALSVVVFPKPPAREL
jgi:hypothetical protein